MEKKKFKLPHIVHLALFLFVLGLICTTILSIVNYITKEPIAEQERLAEEKETQTILTTLDEKGYTSVEDITSLNESILIVESKVQVTQVFSGKKDSSNILAFKVYTKNDFTDFNTLVILINNGNEYIVDDVIVLSNATSLGTSQNNRFYNNNFGVVGSSSESLNKDFAIVAGSSYSSRSVKSAIQAAFNQINVEGFVEVKANE